MCGRDDGSVDCLDTTCARREKKVESRCQGVPAFPSVCKGGNQGDAMNLSPYVTSLLLVVVITVAYACLRVFH